MPVAYISPTESWQSKISLDIAKYLLGAGGRQNHPWLRITDINRRQKKIVRVRGTLKLYSGIKYI